MNWSERHFDHSVAVGVLVVVGVITAFAMKWVIAYRAMGIHALLHVAFYLAWLNGVVLLVIMPYLLSQIAALLLQVVSWCIGHKQNYQTSFLVVGSLFVFFSYSLYHICEQQSHHLDKLTQYCRQKTDASMSLCQSAAMIYERRITYCGLLPRLQSKHCLNDLLVRLEQQIKLT